MARWRRPNLLRLFVGQHIVNGVSVGAGVILVAVVASAIFGFDAGQPATLGAISASISDLPAPWREKARAMGFGFALALLSSTAIQLALPWPPLALLTIGAIAFASGMLTGLGRWSIPLAMQMLIPMVFVLGLPKQSIASVPKVEALLTLGGLGYIAFSLVATILTDGSARRLVASESIREFAIYLRAVAGVFNPNTDLEAAYGAAIRQQAALAEQLQAGRSLLLDRPRVGSERFRLAASIGVLLDAFDALVAAQCDLALIRSSSAASSMLKRIETTLSVGAADIDRLSLELLATRQPTLPPDHHLQIKALARATMLPENAGRENARTMVAMRAAVRRLVLALEHIRRLEQVLSDDREAKASIGDIDLAAFIPRRSYSLAVLKQHLTLSSPVLRFSTRLALAMMAGAIVAQFLGDSGHGNWVLLTIAVIMRANYGLTRQRRDDRIVGTLIGCVAAAGAVAYLPPAALVATQGFAVAMFQSFVRLNYRLASAAASITALVSLHLAQPSLPAPILARLADTLIGAAIAHLFSWVWPHWEFAEAPNIVTRLQARLAAFAEVALRPDAGDQDYRLARKNMIEALAALSDSAGRMSIEPMATRRGLDEMAALLIAAHALVAQLSAARLDAKTGVMKPDAAVGDALRALLSPKGSQARPNAPATRGALEEAARAVTSAADAFQRAAREEME